MNEKTILLELEITDEKSLSLFLKAKTLICFCTVFKVLSVRIKGE